MLVITVGRNDEDYTSIQEAINAVPYGMKAEILISEGFYSGKLFSEKADLTIRGLGNVVIACSECGYEILDRGRKRGTFRSYTAFFGGERIHLENLTIMNGAGDGRDAGQAIALYLDAAEAELSSVRLLGHQDTLFLAPLPDEEREEHGFYGPRHLIPRRRCRSHFRSCLIEGTVDFIFGGGDAFFEDCEIRSVGEGYVTAPSGRKEWTGFVFSGCRFTSRGVEEGSVFLMRPWRKEGKAAFIGCSIGDHIAAEGLSPWPGREDEAGECTFIVSGCSFDGECRIGEDHMASREEAAGIIASCS